MDEETREPELTQEEEPAADCRRERVLARLGYPMFGPARPRVDLRLDECSLSPEELAATQQVCDLPHFDREGCFVVGGSQLDSIRLIAPHRVAYVRDCVRVPDACMYKLRRMVIVQINVTTMDWHQVEVAVCIEETVLRDALRLEPRHGGADKQELLANLDFADFRELLLGVYANVRFGDGGRGMPPEARPIVAIAT